MTPIRRTWIRWATTRLPPNSRYPPRNVWAAATRNTQKCCRSLCSHVFPLGACTCRQVWIQSTWLYSWGTSCRTRFYSSETTRLCAGESQTWWGYGASRDSSWLWVSLRSLRLFYTSIRGSLVRTLAPDCVCSDCIGQSLNRETTFFFWFKKKNNALVRTFWAK